MPVRMGSLRFAAVGAAAALAVLALARCGDETDDAKKTSAECTQYCTAWLSCSQAYLQAQSCDFAKSLAEMVEWCEPHCETLRDDLGASARDDVDACIACRDDALTTSACSSEAGQSAALANCATPCSVAAAATFRSQIPNIPDSYLDACN